MSGGSNASRPTTVEISPFHSLTPLGSQTSMSEMAWLRHYGIAVSNLLAASYKTGEGRSLGTIFVSGLVGPCRRFFTSCAKSGWALCSISHQCFVVVMENNVQK